MVQTMKQILSKNDKDAWLAMLIYKATVIPGILKSPSEMLSRRKFRTNLPMVDVQNKENEEEIESSVETESKVKMANCMNYPPFPWEVEFCMKRILIVQKQKHPEWVKGTIKDKIRENIRFCLTLIEWYKVKASYKRLPNKIW